VSTYPGPVVTSGTPGPERGFEHVDEQMCRSFQQSAELVGRKWTASILMAGMLGARRFAEYRTRVPGISPRLLTLRLRELEADGLVVREVVPTFPVLITYTPTERGAGLMRALQPLIAWSVDDQSDANGSCANG
jgi:DNA-binding HxlR family transcriptional regulator